MVHFILQKFGGKFISKIPNFGCLGAIVPHLCTNKVEILQGEKVGKL